MDQSGPTAESGRSNSSESMMDPWIRRLEQRFGGFTNWKLSNTHFQKRKMKFMLPGFQLTRRLGLLKFPFPHILHIQQSIPTLFEVHAVILALKGKSRIYANNGPNTV